MDIHLSSRMLKAMGGENPFSTVNPAMTGNMGEDQPRRKKGILLRVKRLIRRVGEVFCRRRG